MSDLGLITKTLEAELTEQLRQKGIVVWLDKNACYTNYVDRLRQQHSLYIELAQQVETRLQPELEAMQPEDLGKIDTFPGEEAKVLESAVRPLLASNWRKALNWAESRSEATSFWLQSDRPRRLVWSLVKIAATFGQTIDRDPQP